MKDKIEVTSKLTFPTLAEQAVSRWQAAAKTSSLAKIAARLGGERHDSWPCVIEFTFDDDTVLRITGRGRSHKYETLYP